MFAGNARVFLRNKQNYTNRAAVSLKRDEIGASVARCERLDALGSDDELDHDEDAEQKKPPLQVDGVLAVPGETGDRPAGREGGAEDFGADEDRRAYHRKHMDPDDPAAASRGVVHGNRPLGGRTLSRKGRRKQGS